MILTVVGCSGSVPAADSSASSYLVQYDGFNLVLDLGQGSVGALQNHLDLNAIDAIFLSHLHPDHCIDMTCLYVARRYGRDQPHALLPVHAPPGASDRLADAYGLDRVPGMSNTFTFHESAMTTSIGPFRVRTALMEHPVTNYAVRLDTPTGSLVYSETPDPPTPSLNLPTAPMCSFVRRRLSTARTTPPSFTSPVNKRARLPSALRLEG